MPKKLLPYWQSLPYLFMYQVISKALIGLWVYILGLLFRQLLKSTGRVAVTSGDFTFLFTSWQGILIILIAMVSLFGYVGLDLNTKIALSGDLLTGEKVSVWKSVLEGFASIKHFLCVRGILVVLYIALIAPILGLGISISLTESLYIPTFISSVIAGTPLYLVAVSILVLVFLSVGVANLYLLHGVVLDKLPVREAGLQSKRLIHENWKDYLKQNILFLIVMAVLLALVAAVVLFLPLALVYAIPFSEGVRRVLTILFVTAGVSLSVLTSLFATPFYIMKMTQLFYTYKDGKPFEYTERPKRKHPLILPVLALAGVALAVAVISMNSQFDGLFPQGSEVKIVAHRGGGVEGAENTIAGLETAWEKGAYGGEIDIQRTKDGYYILNHDSDFQRVAGVKQKPEEMTLEEIRALSVDGEPVPTFEEALQASKGKGVLFTELKGETADRQMADDAVRMIREYGMEDQCVLISLKYDLIDYIEQTYPEIQTGFLTFASFGDTARLNCDYLGLEEESATTKAIKAIHEQGKKAIIWTANERKSQRHFICSQADAIITDNISQAASIEEELGARTDLSRMVDRILGIVS